MNLPGKVWTSIELQALYQKNGGKEKNLDLSQSSLLIRIMNFVLTSPGIAIISVLQEKVSSMFKLVSMFEWNVS